MNIRSVSVKHEGLNSRVERLNGTMRDREKVMRGMHSKESAQKLIEAMRIHYNYCWTHSKLWTTLAEQAGIKLEREIVKQNYPLIFFLLFLQLYVVILCADKFAVCLVKTVCAIIVGIIPK